ncbi:hypothetical protein [Spongorhabdus nitratireducens]
MGGILLIPLIAQAGLEHFRFDVTSHAQHGHVFFGVRPGGEIGFAPLLPVFSSYKDYCDQNKRQKKKSKVKLINESEFNQQIEHCKANLQIMQQMVFDFFHPARSRAGSLWLSRQSEVCITISVRNDAGMVDPLLYEDMVRVNETKLSELRVEFEAIQAQRQPRPKDPPKKGKYRLASSVFKPGAPPFSDDVGGFLFSEPVNAGEFTPLDSGRKDNLITLQRYMFDRYSMNKSDWQSIQYLLSKLGEPALTCFCPVELGRIHETQPQGSFQVNGVSLHDLVGRACLCDKQPDGHAVFKLSAEDIKKEPGQIVRQVKCKTIETRLCLIEWFDLVHATKTLLPAQLDEMASAALIMLQTACKTGRVIKPELGLEVIAPECLPLIKMRNEFIQQWQFVHQVFGWVLPVRFVDAAWYKGLFARTEHYLRMLERRGKNFSNPGTKERFDKLLALHDSQPDDIVFTHPLCLDAATSNVLFFQRGIKVITESVKRLNGSVYDDLASIPEGLSRTLDSMIKGQIECNLQTVPRISPLAEHYYDRMSVAVCSGLSPQAETYRLFWLRNRLLCTHPLIESLLHYLFNPLLNDQRPAIQKLEHQVYSELELMLPLKPWLQGKLTFEKYLLLAINQLSGLKRYRLSSLDEAIVLFDKYFEPQQVESTQDAVEPSGGEGKNFAIELLLATEEDQPPFRLSQSQLEKLVEVLMVIVPGVVKQSSKNLQALVEADSGTVEEGETRSSDSSTGQSLPQPSPQSTEEASERSTREAVTALPVDHRPEASPKPVE